MPLLASILAHPKIAASLGAAVVLLLGVGAFELKIHGLRADVADARAKLTAEQQSSALLKAQLAELTANRDQLVGVVNEQNRSIEQLERRGRELEDAAALRAVRRLREGEARRNEALGDHGAAAGPEALNAWVHDALAR